MSVLAEERPFVESGMMSYGRLRPGQQLYDESGNVVAVVQQVTLQRLPIDLTTADDRFERYKLGRLRMTAVVVSV